MADLKQNIMEISQEEVKYHKEEYYKSEKRIVLLGKTGVGKSSTGNTLLGEDIFHVNPFSETATKTCQSFTRERFGEYIRVIDVPGFSGTEFAEDEEKNAIMRCVIEACPGIHAILMVIRIGRFTAEDQQILARFIKYFGEEARQFVMVVFTGLDELQRHNLTIEEYVSKATGDLKDFLKSIGNRYIPVSNLQNTNTEFVTALMLLTRIKGLETMNNGRCYTNALLEIFIQELREKEDKMIQETREGRFEIENVPDTEDLGLLETEATAREEAALAEANENLYNERLKIQKALVNEKRNVKESDGSQVVPAHKQWMKRKRSNLVKWISAVIDKVKNEKYDELSERNYGFRPLPRATVGYMYILK